MKPAELRKKTMDELKKELVELLRERFNLRMQKGIGEVPKPHLYQRVQRNIARVRTILTEKERMV